MEEELSVSYYGYGLSLSDTSTWWITGDGESARWADELAALMQLGKCNRGYSRRLIFKINTAKGLQDNEIETGSEAQTCGFIGNRNPRNDDVVTIQDVPTNGDIICAVENNERHESDYWNYLKMLSSLHPIYQQSVLRGGLPFHAALAEMAGKGVLFAARGGTGKSTCCRRLPDYWKPLCDDETLVVLDAHKTYRAHPFPTWSDYILRRAAKTWNVQYSIPLAGIFFLEQSESDEAVPVKGGQGAVLLTESAFQVFRKFWTGLNKEWERNFMREVFNNACKMTRSIPVFSLRVSLHGRFWEKVEKALNLCRTEES